VHPILLVKHGIHILENINLEELAASRIFEFLFVCLPLKLVGATGSPVRPIAIAFSS
jgi:kynurenine formamidase